METGSPIPRMERPSSDRLCWTIPASVGTMRRADTCSLKIDDIGEFPRAAAGVTEHRVRPRRPKYQRRGFRDYRMIDHAHGFACSRSRWRRMARPRRRASTFGPSIGAIGGRRPNSPSSASTSRYVSTPRRSRSCDQDTAPAACWRISLSASAGSSRSPRFRTAA